MITKHTKGNWFIDIEVDGNMWVNSEESDLIIANICSEYNGELRKYLPTEEEKANAKLIAAAPEMLNALQDIVGQYENTLMSVPADLADSINLFAKDIIKKVIQ